MSKKNLFAAFFSLFSLIVVFFKLPGVGDFFGIKSCASCGNDLPYITMLAASYFAFFTVILLSFNDFPGKIGARAGLVWAVGLCASLTYLSTGLCAICLIAHASHITAWSILVTKQEHFGRNRHVLRQFLGLKLSCALTAAISVMALYSTLNFTFALYGLKLSTNKASLIQAGQKITALDLTTQTGQNMNVKDFVQNKAVVIDFVSNSCPYCKEQLHKLKAVHEHYKAQGIRFIAICRDEAKDLREISPNIDWVQDAEGKHFTSFGVSRFPTMIILDPNAVVMHTVAGLPSAYEKTLEGQLDTLLQKAL